ncbi:MAG TPA: hypothetical protein VFM46_16315 [Pseudomonadales bacterium]|nr:hypothetical protein [Pseudomonadales bacterium]
MITVSTERKRHSGRDDWNEAAIALLEQTRRSVKLFLHSLTPGSYDHTDFLTALGRLARENRNADIRILIVDPMSAIQNGHQLISLARRLSTYIQIRRVGEDYAHNEEEFLLADDSNMMLKMRYFDRDFWVQNNAAPEAQRYTGWFKEAWERSEIDPEFRELKL